MKEGILKENLINQYEFKVDINYEVDAYRQELEAELKGNNIISFRGAKRKLKNRGK